MDTDRVTDVTSADFEQSVIKASERQPVLVDFWAAWCGPCRMLGPILEKVVASYDGRVILTKVNVEREQKLAARFRVTGIPAVKMFVQGRMVDDFTGALPEDRIRDFIDRNLPSPSAGNLAGAREALKEGRIEEAKALLQKARSEDPAAAELPLLDAACALASGEVDRAREIVASIPEHGRFEEERRALRNRLGFIEECSGIPQEGRPVDRLYAQANCIAADGDYQQALELFLKVLSIDRDYREGAVREAMVRIFEIIGRRSSLADEYRDKMAALLY